MANETNREIPSNDPLQRLAQLIILIAKKLATSYQIVIIILTIVFLAILAFLSFISNLFVNKKDQ